MRELLLVFVISFVFFGCSNSMADSEKSTSVAIPDTIEIEPIKSSSLASLIDHFKGKVIYLDVWASWCGPCLIEMPASERLKESFDGDDIQFVYLSIDQDMERWKNTIEAKRIEGIHFLAAPSLLSELQKKYAFSSIPRYMVFDQSGVLIDSNAGRPSDPVTKGLLKNLLIP